MLLAALFGAARAHAAPCDHFAWPLDVERAWLSAGSVERLASGSRRPTIPEGAMELVLVKQAKVAFVVSPEQPPKSPSPRGGTVVFGAVPKPGLYQVTVSRAAWIDLVQNGKRLLEAAETGDPDCPSVHKSLRFRLGAGPVLVQVSDADADAIRLVIRAVE